ncbi:DUF2087 domain-containing protein [Streptomyces albus]
MRNVVVRCCALLLGVAAVWASLDLAVEPYRKTVEYRHAEPCQRAAPRTDACIGRETGRVADKYTRTTTTGSTEDSSTETLYYLRIAREGRTAAYEVSNGLYGAARRGSRAGLDVWQGQVVGITVRGAHDRLSPSAAGDLTFSLFPGWLGAGLLLWAALGGGRLRSLFGPLGTRAFAWVWLARAVDAAARWTDRRPRYGGLGHRRLVGAVALRRRGERAVPLRRRDGGLPCGAPVAPPEPSAAVRPLPRRPSRLGAAVRPGFVRSWTNWITMLRDCPRGPREKGRGLRCRHVRSRQFVPACRLGDLQQGGGRAVGTVHRPPAGHPQRGRRTERGSRAGTPGRCRAEVGLDLKTLSKEVVRLTEAGLLTREGASLTARPEALGDLAASLAEHTALNRIVPPDSPLRRYLSHGRITALPKRPEDLEALALALAALLPEDCSLTENEVNTLLAQAGDDVARLRRLLADFALVDRAGSAEYRRRPLPGPTAAP